MRKSITWAKVLIALLISLQQFSRPAHAEMRSESIEQGTEDTLLDQEDAVKPHFRGLLGGEINYAPGIKTDAHYRGRLVPLFRVEYDEWLYVNNTGGMQAGVWLWQTQDHMRKLGVSILKHPGRTAFDYNARRKDSIDGAINIQWRTPGKHIMKAGYYHDLGDASHGQSIDFSLSRNIIFRHALFNHDCMIVPGIGLEWNSARLVDYYYGVRPEEATPDRPVYVGRDTLNGGVRLTGFYLIKKSWTAFAGIHTVIFGRGITDSPIVTRHIATRGYIGTAWLF
jgi:outer membrane scaffolding protein for murein synthesis (MipA/OmpV family)